MTAAPFVRRPRTLIGMVSSSRDKSLPEGATRLPLRILLNGPIANAGHPATGGYAAANRRTADALRRRGVSVIECSYPVDARGRWTKARAYAGAFLRSWHAVLWRRQYDLLHLTPLNMHFAWPELVTVGLARLVRRPVLFDIRAGTFEAEFAGGSRWYRQVIARALRWATSVSIEGSRYATLVKRVTGAEPWYFPNYVDVQALAPPAVARAAPSRRAPIHLLYVGRLVEEKGVGHALQALRLLVGRGFAATLSLVGTGDAGCMDAWRREARDLPVKWWGALPPDQVTAVAATSHFFLFPSRHAGEGHSNALNEAMAAGVVPIASDQGFSREVIGDAGVVIPCNATPHAYADAITTILREGRWADLSRRAHCRVAANYSEGTMVPLLITQYERALGRAPAPAPSRPLLDAR